MFKRLNNNDRLKELIQEEIKKLKSFDEESIKMVQRLQKDDKIRINRR